VSEANPRRGGTHHKAEVVKTEPLSKNHPYLAEIELRLRWRQPWEWPDPLLVEPDLFLEAQAELETLMRQRGFPVPREAAIRAENFRLFGVTVVRARADG
jgi:hypothetical protein